MCVNKIKESFLQLDFEEIEVPSLYACMNFATFSYHLVYLSSLGCHPTDPI